MNAPCRTPHRKGAAPGGEAARAAAAMFRELASNLPAALWIRDVESGTIVYANRAWRMLTGIGAGRGDPVEKAHAAIHPGDRQWVVHERRKPAGGHDGIEYRLSRPDSGTRWVHARAFPIANPGGGEPFLVEIIEDVTERREAQQRLVHLARHDALTDLPNRTVLYEALHAALARANRDGHEVSLLLVDADEFKSVNDTFGHAAGDLVLREFAARLASCVRPGDTVGRLGGDEFAVVVPTPAESHGGEEIAARICEVLSSPFHAEDQELAMSASIGIATYPEDATGIEELIRRADMAMYEAKAAGRNMFRRFRAGAKLGAPRCGAAAIGAAAPVPAPNWSAANA